MFQKLESLSSRHGETHQTTLSLRNNTSRRLTDTPGLQRLQEVKSNRKNRHTLKSVCLSHSHEDQTGENILHQILVNISATLGSGRFESVQDLKHAIL